LNAGEGVGKLGGLQIRSGHFGVERKLLDLLGDKPMFFQAIVNSLY
jgi:hypothetical protein